ncbi:hypothetical protein KM043_013378 [Ampulex compressa]|nr:hypothetical protein KM043_013378 [Ampulex compressa]
MGRRGQDEVRAEMGIRIEEIDEGREKGREEGFDKVREEWRTSDRKLRVSLCEIGFSANNPVWRVSIKLTFGSKTCYSLKRTMREEGKGYPVVKSISSTLS